MEALDKAFSEANCETITVIEEVPQPDGSKAWQEYIHKGHTVRAGLTLAPVEVTPATEQAPAVFENRITRLHEPEKLCGKPDGRDAPGS